MTILITGATGAIGRLVVDGLLTADASVRAVSRTPEKAGLPDGAQVFGTDLNAPETYPAGLFEDVQSVLVFPLAGVDALVTAARASGVKRFIVLSSLAAALEHPRDVGSASAVHHQAVESAVTSNADSWAILRPGTFANNLLSWAHSISSGTPIRAPYLESAQAPVHEADVADALVAMLLEPRRWEGHAVPLTGPESLTRRAQVATIAAAIGKSIELVEASPGEFRAEAARFIPDGIITMLLDYWRDTVDEPDLVRSKQLITGQPGRTLRQWAHDHKSEFGPHR